MQLCFNQYEIRDHARSASSQWLHHWTDILLYANIVHTYEITALAQLDSRKHIYEICCDSDANLINNPFYYFLLFKKILL